MIKGVDISRYNAGYKVEKDIDFVIVKASEGRSATNTEFDKQIKMARESGAVVGTYHWLHANNVRDQARFYVDKARPRPGEFLVCDWEQQGVTDDMKDEFIREVKRLAPNNKCLLYCNPSWWKPSNRNAWDGLWIANYGVSSPRIDDPWVIWQYTESPRDYNYAKFDSRAGMLRWAGGNTVDSPPAYEIPQLKERISWRETPGGNPVRACTCMIESIEKVVEPRLKAAGIIKYSVDSWQGAYSNGSLSGNTHAGGGAIDVVQCSDEAVKIWRGAGWTFWRRGDAEFGDGFDRHGHGVLRGCPHLSSAAENQITQYRQGDNGLVNDRNDPHGDLGRPTITWQDAIRDYLGASAPAAGGGTSAPQHDDDIEEFLMTARFDRHRCSKPQKLGKVGKWQYLYITDKNNISLSDGPARILGHVYVQMKLAQGQSAYFRIVEDEQDGNGKTSRRYTYEDHEEISGTGGGTYKKFPITLNAGGPSKGKTANYVRIQWHSSDPGAEIIRCGVHRYDGK